MTDHETVLICDACVLIDYFDTTRDILTLAARHIGPVMVTTMVLDETDHLDREMAEELGLTVIEPGLEILAEASRTGGAPSRSDKVTFAVVKSEGWICWTSDKGLRKLCSEHGIKVFWGLEIMLVLCKSGHLTRTVALRTARSISRINRYITDEILADFEVKIELMKKGRP